MSEERKRKLKHAKLMSGSGKGLIIGGSTLTGIFGLGALAVSIPFLYEISWNGWGGAAAADPHCGLPDVRRRRYFHDRLRHRQGAAQRALPELSGLYRSQPGGGPGPHGRRFRRARQQAMQGPAADAVQGHPAHGLPGFGRGQAVSHRDGLPRPRAQAGGPARPGGDPRRLPPGRTIFSGRSGRSTTRSRTR